MDHSIPIGGSLASGGTRPNSPNANPVNVRVEDAAKTAHQATDKIGDEAAGQVDRLTGTAHRAIDGAAGAASSAAEWASNIPERAKQVQAQLGDAVSASIRAHPIATVTGALFVGYLLGRLGRL